jgi:hypothetical protein
MNLIHPLKKDTEVKQYWGDSGDDKKEWEDEGRMLIREEFDDMCKQVWDMVDTEGMSLENAMYLYLEIKEV